MSKSIDNNRSQTEQLDINAGTLVKQNKFAEAVLKYQESLKIKQQIYKKPHQDIAKSLMRIGDVYYKQANYVESLKYYYQVLDMTTNIFGDNTHNLIIESLTSIATVSQAEGNYNKALSYYEAALQKLRIIYDYKHNLVAIAMDNLGNLEEQFGDYTAALNHYNKSMLIRSAIYGNKHPLLTENLRKIDHVHMLQEKLLPTGSFVQRLFSEKTNNNQQIMSKL